MELHSDIKPYAPLHPYVGAIHRDMPGVLTLGGLWGLVDRVRFAETTMKDHIQPACSWRRRGVPTSSVADAHTICVALQQAVAWVLGPCTAPSKPITVILKSISTLDFTGESLADTPATRMVIVELLLAALHFITAYDVVLDTVDKPPTLKPESIPWAQYTALKAFTIKARAVWPRDPNVAAITSCIRALLDCSWPSHSDNGSYSEVARSSSIPFIWTSTCLALELAVTPFEDGPFAPLCDSAFLANIAAAHAVGIVVVWSKIDSSYSSRTVCNRELLDIYDLGSLSVNFFDLVLATECSNLQSLALVMGCVCLNYARNGLPTGTGPRQATHASRLADAALRVMARPTTPADVAAGTFLLSLPLQDLAHFPEPLHAVDITWVEIIAHDTVTWVIDACIKNKLPLSEDARERIRNAFFTSGAVMQSICSKYTRADTYILLAESVTTAIRNGEYWDVDTFLKVLCQLCTRTWSREGATSAELTALARVIFSGVVPVHNYVIHGRRIHDTQFFDSLGHIDLSRVDSDFVSNVEAMFHGALVEVLDCVGTCTHPCSLLSEGEFLDLSANAFQLLKVANSTFQLLLRCCTPEVTTADVTALQACLVVSKPQLTVCGFGGRFHAETFKADKNVFQLITAAAPYLPCLRDTADGTPPPGSLLGMLIRYPAVVTGDRLAVAAKDAVAQVCTQRRARWSPNRAAWLGSVARATLARVALFNTGGRRNVRSRVSVE